MHSGLVVHYCYFNVVRNLLNGSYGPGIAKSKVTDLIKCPEFIAAYFFLLFLSHVQTRRRDLRILIRTDVVRRKMRNEFQMYSPRE